MMRTPIEILTYVVMAAVLTCAAIVLAVHFIGTAEAHGRCWHDRYGRDICPNPANTRVREYSALARKKCLPRVRAVGSQWVGEKGAKASSIKAWREIVRFDHGEKYSDWRNVNKPRHGCSQSSIGEVLGKVMFRCTVSAVPCRMTITEGTE